MPEGNNVATCAKAKTQETFANCKFVHAESLLSHENPSASKYIDLCIDSRQIFKRCTLEWNSLLTSNSLVTCAWAQSKCVAEELVTTVSATHASGRRLCQQMLHFILVHFMPVDLRYLMSFVLNCVGFFNTIIHAYSFQRIQQRCYTHSDTGTAALLHEKASNTCGI